MNNYTEEIARTTKNPQILTDILRRGNDDSISRYAASNPKCPPEALAEILKRENSDDVSRTTAYSVALNPSCPLEILAEVLERGKNNYLSQYAARNPNCPPEALYQWLIITNNLNDPDYSTLLPKIQQYLQKQENEQNILLQNAKSKYNNPILSLEI
jgi:hypothetical protein